MWKEHFQAMVRGDIPYQKKMYTGLQNGSGNIKVVSPTEAVVQQAKSDLKRSLQEADVFKPKKARFLLQSGSGVKKRAKRTTSKKNKKSKKKNTKQKSKTRKTKVSKRKKSGVTSKKGKNKRRKKKSSKSKRKGKR